jgi:hypothetical protein
MRYKNEGAFWRGSERTLRNVLPLSVKFESVLWVFDDQEPFKAVFECLQAFRS